MPRTLHLIAKDIRNDWKNVNYAAKPYLIALSMLDTPSDRYFNDSGKDMVLYFLSNAGTWRGSVAKAIKSELREMLK